MTCPHCGTVNRDGSAFCKDCGTTMAPPADVSFAPVTMTNINLCPNCGAALAPDAAFCGNCGMTAGASPPTAAPPPPFEPPPVQPRGQPFAAPPPDPTGP